MPYPAYPALPQQLSWADHPRAPARGEGAVLQQVTHVPRRRADDSGDDNADDNRAPAAPGEAGSQRRSRAGERGCVFLGVKWAPALVIDHVHLHHPVDAAICTLQLLARRMQGRGYDACSTRPSCDYAGARRPESGQKRGTIVMRGRLNR
jgi:hypothetical protein